MPVSLALKPEPVTVTELPTAPLVRLREMTGVTVKIMSGMVVAEVEEPYASMVWEPEGEAGTTKVALQSPRELAEGTEGIVTTSLPSKVTLMGVSLALKPEPVTVTEVPGAPLVGLKEIVGVVA